MLDRTSLISMVWSCLGTIGQQTTAFGVLLLLTRHLDPAAFGIAAMAFAIFDLLQLVVRAGLTETLTRSSTIDDQHLSTAFWTATGLGACIAGGLYAVSAQLAEALSMPPLAGFLQLLAFGLAISGLAPVFEAIMLRDMRFKVMAQRNIGGTVSAGCLAIGLAVTGHGALALIAQRLAYTTWQLVVAMSVCSWRPSFAWRRDAALKQLAIGRVFTIASVLGMGNQRIVDLIVGATLGPVALGYLRIAWRALELLLELTISSINRVLLPALSRATTTPGRMPSAYHHGLAVAAVVAYPLVTGAALVAPDALPLIFGGQWQQSVLLFQLLATSVLFVPLIYFKSTLLFVADKLTAIIWLNVFEFVLSVAVTLLTTQVGLAAAAYGNTLRMAIATPVIMGMLARTAGIDTKRTCASVLAPLCATASMVVVLLALQPMLPDTPMVRLVVMIITGASVYAVSLYLLMGNHFLGLMAEESARSANGLMSGFGCRRFSASLRSTAA